MSKLIKAALVSMVLIATVSCASTSTPTPTTAFKIGEKTNDPLKMYLADIMTVGANLVGIPAVSIPVGEVGGLPVGLQIMAPQKNDRRLLNIAKEAERLNK